MIHRRRSDTLAARNERTAAAVIAAAEPWQLSPPGSAIWRNYWHHLPCVGPRASGVAGERLHPANRSSNQGASTLSSAERVV